MDTPVRFPVCEQDIVQNLPYYQRTAASLFLVYESTIAPDPLTLEFDCGPEVVHMRLEDNWQEDEDVDHLSMIRELIAWIERLFPQPAFALHQIRLGWGSVVEQTRNVQEEPVQEQWGCYVEATLLTLYSAVRRASACSETIPSPVHMGFEHV